VGLGRAVRRLRTNAGHSQDRFAQIVGLDRTYVSRNARGLANVTLEMLDSIAKALISVSRTSFRKQKRRYGRGSAAANRRAVKHALSQHPLSGVSESRCLTLSADAGFLLLTRKTGLLSVPTVGSH
jgi:transcriptional regulator with XRE-family HTH domain